MLRSDLCLILPEFKLFWDFMPVQVISNFHKDPIKTKQAMRSGQGHIWGVSELKGK